MVPMSSGRIFRFGPNGSNDSARRPTRLFVFLHGCGATARSMIPIAFKFQARFPSAALVVPSGFDPDARGGAAQDWYPTHGLNCDNHGERVAAVLPDFEDLVRREQTNFGVTASQSSTEAESGTTRRTAISSPIGFASVQRSTAVFNPENEKSNALPFIFARVNRMPFGFP